MGLKHLQGTVWAVCLVSAVGALAQPVDPNADPDNDGVLGDADLCPSTRGDPNNFGCPSNEEVVVVYGTRDSYTSVECPDGETAWVYTDCAGFSGWDSYYLAYHEVMTGVYSGETTHVVVESADESEPATTEEEEITLEDGSTFGCHAKASAVQTLGGVMTLGGALLGARAPDSAIGAGWKAYPTYDGLGVFHNGIYWDEAYIRSAASEGSDPHIGDAFGAAFALAGAAVVVVGGVVHAGCYIVGED